jgi:acyl carrier protein
VRTIGFDADREHPAAGVIRAVDGSSPALTGLALSISLSPIMERPKHVDQIRVSARPTSTPTSAAGHSIGPEDAFDQAGVDSLALLRILVFVESSFGVWIPDEDLEGHVGCVRALAQYVAARTESGS